VLLFSYLIHTEKEESKRVTPNDYHGAGAGRRLSGTGGGGRTGGGDRPRGILKSDFPVAWWWGRFGVEYNNQTHKQNSESRKQK